jgi:hypothetical protein
MTHSPAREAAYAALRAQAVRSARDTIKDLVHEYALHPRYLDAIRVGLSDLTPGQLVRALEHICRPPDWRWFGFGGEIPALNLRGAMLYARFARAKAHQLARRAAA